MKRLLALLFAVMSSAALAQTTGTLNPSPAPAQPSVNQDVPPGGCMPIGLTASGEIVFPIQCRGIIEQQRG
jgi:outer membrane biosynthesis protein TonB